MSADRGLAQTTSRTPQFPRPSSRSRNGAPLQWGRATLTGWIWDADDHCMSVEPGWAPGEQSRFEATWLPRIGPKATAQLRASSHRSLALSLTCFAASLAASFAFASGTALGRLLGVALVAVAITAVAARIRSQSRLAAALSEWFGVRITWHDLPSMGRLGRFDAWCRKRNLSAPAGPSGTDENPWA